MYVGGNSNWATPTINGNVYVNGNASLSHEEACKRIVAAYDKLGVKASVLQHRQWAYFPRPLGDAQLIDQGIMATQGRGGAWLAGAYFAYESTFSAFQNGRRVSRHQSARTEVPAGGNARSNSWRCDSKVSRARCMSTPAA